MLIETYSCGGPTSGRSTFKGIYFFKGKLKCCAAGATSKGTDFQGAFQELQTTVVQGQNHGTLRLRQAY